MGPDGGVQSLAIDSYESRFVPAAVGSEGSELDGVYWKTSPALTGVTDLAQKVD